MSNLLIINVESDLFYNLDKDVIVDKLSRAIEELAKKLLS